MIKFFRRIRQNLLLEGKAGKYMKYAIGEIILVVIGILIALQINNWNEGRKSNNKTEYLLTQLHKELSFNINRCNHVIRYYRDKDSIIYKVLNKQATYNDYKTNRKYSGVLHGIPLANLKDKAYKNLTNHEKKLTQQQDSIVAKIIVLYERNKKSVDLMDELALTRLQKNAQKLREEKSWYYDYHVQRENTDEMVNYFLNDPYYLNEVTHYSRTNLRGHNGGALTFRNNALELYKDLSIYLDLKQDSTIIKELSNYEHYIGIYSDSLEILEIKKEEDIFIYTRKNKKDSIETRRFILYPDSKTYFTVSNGFGKLTFNNNEVKELTISLGHTRVVYKKVN